MNASFTNENTYQPDGLVAGNSSLLVSRKVILAAGQSLNRGAVLGEITASGKYTLSLSASEDGSQVPDLVLSEDCDASAADKQALAYARGDFATSALTLGTGHTIDYVAEGLRVKGITLISVMA